MTTIIGHTSPETNAHPTTTTAPLRYQSPGPFGATKYSVA
jgi:hypothetical protein